MLTLSVVSESGARMSTSTRRSLVDGRSSGSRGGDVRGMTRRTGGVCRNGAHHRVARTEKPNSGRMTEFFVSGMERIPSARIART